jgi:hypothetical protein
LDYVTYIKNCELLGVIRDGQRSAKFDVDQFICPAPNSGHSR